MSSTTLVLYRLVNNFSKAWMNLIHNSQNVLNAILGKLIAGGYMNFFQIYWDALDFQSPLAVAFKCDSLNHIEFILKKLAWNLNFD